MRERKVYPVSSIVRYVKNLLDQNPVLQSIWVKGEIADYSPSGAFLFFTLKEGDISLSCACFNPRGIRFFPQNGDLVEARGRLTIYEKGGRFQMVVDTMEKSGSGSFYEAFERLKEELGKRGWFDEDRKKPIPLFPRKIGIVTSENADALRDVIRVSRERDPSIRLVLSPCLVQGERAPLSIISALKKLDAMDGVDLILLVRGGGSTDDLACFNDEELARAIYEAKTPIITGVGHETDFTIVDFVADKRASTPSNAAELAVVERKVRYERVQALSERMRRHIKTELENVSQRLAYAMLRLEGLSPQNRIAKAKERLEALHKTRERALLHSLELKRLSLSRLSQALELSSPQKPLEKGYAMIFSEGGEVIRSAGEVSIGETIRLELLDGALRAEIKGKQQHET